MSDQNAITVVEAGKVIALRSAWDMNALKERLDHILFLREHIMIKGIHYGPPYKDSKKDVLLKPGAELLLAFFALRPEYAERKVIEDFDRPLFFYRYDCLLYDIVSGLKIGSAIGSCNSMESKYRWRQGGRACPACGQTTIRKSKFPDRKTGDIGFYCSEKEGGCGSNFPSTDKRITEQEQGRVPNDDIFSVVNTIDKQAQKRAMLASTLVTTGASYLFTQDVEDFRGYEYFGDPDAIDGIGSDIPGWILVPEQTLSFSAFLSANHLNIDELRQRTGVNILAYQSLEEAQEAITAALKKPALPVGAPRSGTNSKPSSENEHWLNHHAAEADAWLATHQLRRADVKRTTGKAIGEYASFDALKKDVEIALRQQEPPPKPTSSPAVPPASSKPQPPKAEPKPAANSDAWTDERKLNAGRWVRDNFDQSSDEMLKLLGKQEWTDFPTPKDVIPAVLALVSQREMPVVARSLVYTVQGRGDKAKKVCILKTVAGDFTVFGGREGLTTRLGDNGAQFAETHALAVWEPDGKVTHDLGALPVKVVWKWKGDAKEIIRLAVVQPDEVDFSSDAPPQVPEADAAFAQI